MIVFAAGMQRSGSTFSFNVLRDALMSRGRVHQAASGALEAALAEADTAGADHLLLKAHAADDALVRMVRLGAVRAVCTVRRPDDAVASFMETFGFDLEQSIETMRCWLAFYDRVRRSALVVPYELIDRSPVRAAWRIGRVVDPNLSPLEAWRIARRHRKAAVKARLDALDRADRDVVDIGFSFHEADTFFHRRHVSSLTSRPAEARLRPEQLSAIRSALEPQLAALREPWFDPRFR